MSLCRGSTVATGESTIHVKQTVRYSQGMNAGAREFTLPRPPGALRKPVFSLALVPQNSKITALGRRTWNVLLHIAQNQGLEQETFRAALTDIVKGLDYNSGDMKIIKTHLRSMVSTLVEWQSPTSGEWQTWDVCGMLSHARLSKERGQVFVEWSYAVNMRHELLDPEIFTKLSLDVISQLGSHPAVALYEICSRYIGVGQTARKAWSWWRPVLLGRPDDERLQKLEYRIFKRDTLRPAVAEINAVADIEIEMLEFKSGRFVSDLQFAVRKKPQKALALQQRSAAEPVDVAVLASAERLGIEPARVERLIDEFGEAAVTTGLEAVERRAASAFPEPLRDPLRYLKSVLPGHAAEHQQDAELKVQDAAQAQAATTLAPSEKLANWEKKWLVGRIEHIINEIGSLSQERQSELVEGLRESLVRRNAHPAVIQRLAAKGWTHAMVRHEMVSFYATAAYGADWDKPTDRDLLVIATE
ncbi:Initiator Replication protein [Variovorax sp. OK605]|uniref:replication initiation protein n=1 Tax=Variovorax sp. OK605 TaxID=1855317 RepID=UPI0008E4C31E|nr:replication initiation protein [Variovorax sp. OK605]SFQ58910.1 Initiator Replication protein [Variovorax sp. OK605]